MTNLEKYRASEAEKQRTEDLVRVLPRGRRSVLDVGARDGHFSRILTEYFPEVTALDLVKPPFEYPGVVTVGGDATKLQFDDGTFDCVFCAEVLEHIPDVEKACSEIARVARHEIVVGVPYRQDTRVGRTTCRSCGKANPPWGHVNTFDENRLLNLFPGLRVISKSFTGTNRERTNALATMMMDLGGNPWGAYEQEEPCIYCGARLVRPENRSFLQKVCAGMAARLYAMQARFTAPHGNWIHIVFSKDGSPS